MHSLHNILANACGEEKITTGDFITVPVDVAFVNDLYLQVILSFKDIGDNRVWSADKIAFIMDHYAPSPTIQAASNQKKMRDFVHEQGIKHLFDVNKGICHQVVPESGLLRPGMILVGTDSHTTTHGAYGCFSTGVGATDMAGILYTGEIWLRVPEIIQIIIKGIPQTNVMAKDIMLHIISQLGTDAALYRAIDFSGDTVKWLNLDERLVLCNMAVEMGAKATYIQPDEKVFAYFHQLGYKINESQKNNLMDLLAYSKVSREDFQFVRKFDISSLIPQIALPHQVDKVVRVDEIEGQNIDQVVIGTCTGGRINDIKVAAKMLEGRRVSSGTRLLIIPASGLILKQCIRQGYIQTLLDSGATIVTPSCGPCLGAHEGILAPGESCISTSSRNFPGRMGSTEANIYLSSPATAAATAVYGKITDPRKISEQ